VREVFVAEEPSLAPAAPDAPAVFRRRADKLQGMTAKAAAPAPPVAASGDAMAQAAVFFKLGTVMRPSCAAVMPQLAAAAVTARVVHIVGVMANNKGDEGLSATLASQRATLVANRLVDLGLDRYRIELSLQTWDELPLAAGVWSAEPRPALRAQGRRVDIRLLKD